MGMAIRTYTSHAFGTYGSSPWLLRPPAPSPLACGQSDTRFVNAREEVEKAALRLLLHVEERPSEHMEERRTASPRCWCAHRVHHGLIYDGMQGHAFGRKLIEVCVSVGSLALERRRDA